MKPENTKSEPAQTAEWRIMMKTAIAVVLLSAICFGQGLVLPPPGDPWWKSETGKAYVKRERADMSRWASNPQFKENFAEYCYWSKCDPYQLNISKSLKKFYANYAPVPEPFWESRTCKDCGWENPSLWVCPDGWRVSPEKDSYDRSKSPACVHGPSRAYPPAKVKP